MIREPAPATKSWLNVGITARAVAPERRRRRSARRASRGPRGPPRRRSPRSGGGLGDLLGVAGQERRADGVGAAAGSSKPGLGGPRAQERVRDLDQDAGAVARVGLGARGTAVLEVAQRGERLRHDVVAGDAGQGRDERHATRIVLVAGVVEALWRRERRAGRAPSSVSRRGSSGGPWRCRGRHWDAERAGSGYRRAALHPRQAVRIDVGRASLRHSVRGPRRRASEPRARTARRRGSLRHLLAARVARGAAHHEVGRGEHEQHDRGPDVEPQAEDVVELDVVDAQLLDPAAARACRS